MATITITLSDEQKAFLESQIAEGGYRSADEYVGKLLRRAQVAKHKERIDQLLLEAIENGQSALVTTQEWDEIHKEVLGTPARRSKPRNGVKRASKQR